MVTYEKSLIELFIEVADEMLATNRWYFKGEALQLHCHIVNLLNWLWSVDEVLDLVGDLQCSV